MRSRTMPSGPLASTVPVAERSRGSSQKQLFRHAVHPFLPQSIALGGEPEETDRRHRIGHLSGQRRLDRATRGPDTDTDVLVLVHHAGVPGDAVAISLRRLHAAGIEFAHLVRAARRQQEAADPQQCAHRQPHLLHHLAPRRRLGRFAIVAEAGWQFDQHGVETRDQRRQPELLDQHHRVGDRIVRQHCRGTAASPHLPGLHAGEGTIKATMSESHYVQRETAGPYALLGTDLHVRVSGKRRKRVRRHRASIEKRMAGGTPSPPSPASLERGMCRVRRVRRSRPAA